jgi:hypothetical protein
MAISVGLCAILKPLYFLQLYIVDGQSSHSRTFPSSSPHNPRQIVINDSVSGVRFRSTRPIKTSPSPLFTPRSHQNQGVLRSLRAGRRCGVPPSQRLTALIYPALRKSNENCCLPSEAGPWSRLIAPQFSRCTEGQVIQLGAKPLPQPSIMFQCRHAHSQRCHSTSMDPVEGKFALVQSSLLSSRGKPLDSSLDDWFR